MTPPEGLAWVPVRGGETRPDVGVTGTHARGPYRWSTRVLGTYDLFDGWTGTRHDRVGRDVAAAQRTPANPPSTAGARGGLLPQFTTRRGGSWRGEVQWFPSFDQPFPTRAGGLGDTPPSRGGGRRVSREEVGRLGQRRIQ